MFRILTKLTLAVMLASLFLGEAQARFIQPDWLEVTKPGVGTNRYAYSFNDPINKMDPSGNETEPDGTDYGVLDENGENQTDDSGMGVSKEHQRAANNRDPVIEGQFASGSKFAGMSKAVTNRTQANNYAAAQKSLAQQNSEFQKGVQDLALGAGLLAAPIEGVVLGGPAVAVGVISFADDAARSAGRAIGRMFNKTDNSVPQKAIDVVSYVAQNKSPPHGYKGGRSFANDARQNSASLPAKTVDGRQISYKEYDVNPYTKGVNRGAERAVVGYDSKGNIVSGWYTSDHYRSFTSMFGK